MTSKRLEKAEKLLWKSKPEAALEEFLAVLQEEPGNEVARENAADLCISLQRTSQAVALLSDLFNSQAASGNTNKAALNYKKLARAGTPTVDQTFRYAQLSEKSNRKEALEAYEHASKIFAGQGRIKDALNAIKRLTTLDPSAENIEREGILAESLKETGHAAECYLKLGQIKEESGEGGFSWYKRAFALAPSDPATLPPYIRGLVEQGDSAAAVRILEPLSKSLELSAELRELYARALLGEKRAADAGPHIWQLFEQDPKHLIQVGELIALLIDTRQEQAAMTLTQQLDQHETKAGRRREFVGFIQEIVKKRPVGILFQEYLAGIYNAANREADYCDTLVRLFELHFAERNFIKAADSLDRAAEVDPYIEGLASRLETLRGKIDANRWNSIANRLQKVAGVQKVADTPREQAAQPHVPEKIEEGSEPTVLEDFILQAEIFMQYSMKAKALERLERINKLFPHEEEKNTKLRMLYVTAGFTPKYAGKASAAKAAPAVGIPAGSAAKAGAAAMPSKPAPDGTLDHFSRVTEISRNINRQSNVKNVLFTGVNDVGRHWNASRCVAGLCSPGKPPSSVLEYCAPGMPQSDVVSIVKLLAGLQRLVVKQGVAAIDNVASASELADIKEHIEALGIKSLLAVPLLDGEEHVGLLILQQCDAARSWQSADTMVLKTLGDQMILAVNNAKLRNLVKTLAVTDEKSGLMKRSSYLDVLLSEARRSLQQTATFTLMLLNFGKGSALVKEIGEAAVESMMQTLGQTVCAHVRQNDVAFRYDRTTIALLLADTEEKNAMLVAEKMRKVVAGTKVPDTDRSITMSVGIAEGLLQTKFDAVDIVTEVINRAEAALDAAHAKGPNSSHSLAPNLESAEVA